jgi:hypothetical protein
MGMQYESSVLSDVIRKEMRSIWISYGSSHAGMITGMQRPLNFAHPAFFIDAFLWDGSRKEGDGSGPLGCLELSVYRKLGAWKKWNPRG